MAKKKALSSMVKDPKKRASIKSRVAALRKAAPARTKGRSDWAVYIDSKTKSVRKPKDVKKSRGKGNVKSKKDPRRTDGIFNI